MNELKRKQADSNVVATSHETIAPPKSKVKSKKNPSGTSGRPPLNVQRKEEDRITPQAGGRLTVPREEIEDDYSAGEELDLTSGIAATIGRPGNQEWFRPFPNLELQTKLLVRKPNAFDVEYYSVDPKLRKRIASEIKQVRVIPYYNISAKCYGLWIINVFVGNSWYESQRSLLSRDDKFFDANKIRMRSDKESRLYRFFALSLETTVNKPPDTTGELLGQALGEDHFIRDINHPVYQSLIEGEEIN